jgi:thioredoxin-related protein
MEKGMPAAVEWFHVKPRLARAVRRLGALGGILAWFFLGVTAAHGGEGVPLARDLRADGMVAKEKKIPLLVMFGTPACPYCKLVLNDFLVPMSRNADYQGKVMMRQVEINSDRPLLDFSGKGTSHRRFAKAYQIKLAPTVVMFDAEGRVVGEPMVGVSTPDYYGAFLDRAIDEAVEKVRSPKER